MYLLENELRVIQKLRHRHICQFYEILQTTNNIYIANEYCNQGDLLQVLKRDTRIPEEQAKRYLHQILLGFMEMVSKNIIHRDIKPSNILLKDQEVKIADFGFAIERNQIKTNLAYNVGTPNYMSPQALTQQDHTFKSDIWSIGILYYEMLYGRFPWYAQNEKHLYSQILTNPVPFPYDVKVSPLSIDFITQCLTVDEQRRIGPERILAHPLFLHMESLSSKTTSANGSSTELFKKHNLQIKLNNDVMTEQILPQDRISPPNKRIGRQKSSPQCAGQPSQDPVSLQDQISNPEPDKPMSSAQDLQEEYLSDLSSPIQGSFRHCFMQKIARLNTVSKLLLSPRPYFQRVSEKPAPG